jgi:hypothetical protein
VRPSFFLSDFRIPTSDFHSPSHLLSFPPFTFLYSPQGRQAAPPRKGQRDFTSDFKKKVFNKRSAPLSFTSKS